MTKSTTFIAGVCAHLPEKTAASHYNTNQQRGASGTEINGGTMPQKLAKLALVFSAPFLLSACGGSGQQSGQQSVDSAFQSFQADREGVEALQLMQGLTQVSEIPTGSATYSGTMVGGFMESSDDVTGWTGDVRTNVYFDARAITGSVDNIVTSVAGFETPEGSVDLLGGPLDDGAGNLIYIIEGSGILTQDGTAANLVVAGHGLFIGDDAQMMSGTQHSDLTWTAGANVGQVNEMSGLHILNQE